jgi:hypothetical protein
MIFSFAPVNTKFTGSEKILLSRERAIGGSCRASASKGNPGMTVRLAKALPHRRALPLDAMRRQPFAGGGKALRRPDMIPLAIVHYGLQAPRFFGAVENPDQRENAIGNAGEGPAVQQLEAGEEKGRYLTLAAAMRVS